jgi:predicted TIM-barrel fold metal-dependent hydrolase
MIEKSFHSLTTRRDFLKHTGMMAAGAHLITNKAISATSAINDVVDCHIHLWAADKEKFPFHPNAPYIPEHVSTIEQWLADRQNSGVAIGIFVSGEPYQDNHRYVIHCMEKAPDLLRGTCLFNPNAPESPRRMESLVKGRNFVAARVHSTGTINSAEWHNPHFEAFWEKVGELDLVLQLHMHPEWSWELERMVKKYPNVRVVIDHMGRPRQGNPVDYEVTLGLSVYPNVYMKLSSYADQSTEDPPYENLKPLFKEIVRRFSPERLVWGDSYRGGIGTTAYNESIRITRHLLDFLPAEKQRQIFVETPRKLFKL